MQDLKAALTRTKLLTLVIALTAIAVPVLFAIDQSRRQGQDAEMERVLAYARDVQSRTDMTAEQILNGINKLLDAHPADPCSEAQVAIMRGIDLSSSYIQAIGHVSNGVLVCSSLGPNGSGWRLGPVDLVTSRGAIVRTNVKIPFAPGSVFTVVERDGYAAIINKSLPIDVTTSEKDVSLATFSLDNFHIFTERGLIKPEWIKALRDHPQVTFFEGGYVVAVVSSTQFRTGALAALPATYMNRQMRNLALVLVPVGFMGGLLLAFAVLYLLRVQTSMPAVLKGALRRHEFFIQYQPVVDLQSGAWVGAEALLRWRRPNGEMVRPDIFIPVAEEAGLIKQLTRRVVQLVARDAAEVFKKHPDFHLAINLSAADLQSEHIVELLQGMVRDTAAAPGNLIVEATERGFMDAALARKNIGELRVRGIQIAIDDFGTGYSSLSYLETFELDFLKIDKSFVDKIGTEAPTKNVVQHIIGMANAMRLTMIAEGVETEAQARFLRDQGVQYAQGWLFGKPMAWADMMAMLVKKPACETADQSEKTNEVVPSFISKQPSPSEID
jgi:sensor c-di-GMP phosphodiesterase-like protein